MRLFFALWPDDATREAVRHATRTIVRHCGGKPVPPENYHATLAFLGTVPEERFGAIVAAAGRLAVEPLTLTLERLGWFAAAQVLWLGPLETPEALRRLNREIWTAVAQAGITPDPKPFHVHLTLARKVRLQPELPPRRPIAWPVAGFSLVESDTDPTGARYREVAKFPARP